jgi:hypothetical protein
MARIKKHTLAALFALALLAGGQAFGAGAAQLAGSNPKSFGRESSYQISFIDDEEIIEQVAGSAGGRSSAGRESS